MCLDLRGSAVAETFADYRLIVKPSRIFADSAAEVKCSRSTFAENI